MKLTSEQAKAALDAMRAIADTIRDLGKVPSGVLYAQVMPYMDLATYDKIIQTLKNCGLVTEAGHVLTWTGPTLEVKP